jgi:hypothetical protein
MTAPSLYQQEMAKRQIAIPKATGCPRTAPAPQIVVQEKMKPGRKTNAVRDMLRSRWPEWARLYVQEGWTLGEIGQQFGVRYQSVQFALNKMGVPRRKQGVAWVLKRATRKLAEAQSDVTKLRMVNAGLRKRLSKYEEAA